MEALDRYTFEQWQEEHKQYLEAKFVSVCSKLDTIKAQRLEDCEACEKYRKECQGHISTEIEQLKKSSRKADKLLLAGIVLSVLVCLAATGYIPVVTIAKFLGAIIFGA